MVSGYSSTMQIVQTTQEENDLYEQMQEFAGQHWRFDPLAMNNAMVRTILSAVVKQVRYE